MRGDEACVLLHRLHRTQTGGQEDSRSLGCLADLEQKEEEPAMICIKG